MHPIFKCILPGRPEAVPYIWYILPLMLIYSLQLNSNLTR